MDKQTEINKQFASLHQALLFLLRKNRDRMKQIEEEISNYEENLVIIMEKIKDLHSSLEQLKK